MNKQQKSEWINNWITAVFFKLLQGLKWNIRFVINHSRGVWLKTLGVGEKGTQNIGNKIWLLLLCIYKWLSQLTTHLILTTNMGEKWGRSFTDSEGCHFTDWGYKGPTDVHYFAFRKRPYLNYFRDEYPIFNYLQKESAINISKPFFCICPNILYDFIVTYFCQLSVRT